MNFKNGVIKNCSPGVQKKDTDVFGHGPAVEVSREKQILKNISYGILEDFMLDIGS